MTSIVIPAHNESMVIDRALRALVSGALPNEFEVIVVCNGCSDETAGIAKKFGDPVRVVETEIANKSHALNLADQAARTYPRIYIDADVVVTIGTIRALVRRLESGAVLAVAPRPFFELTGCSWAVRAFYDIRRRLPSFGEGIGGSGVYALSETARRRFGDFPKLVADDAFVRVQFKPEERETLADFNSIVFAPRKVSNLIGIETRADFGNFQLAHLHPELLTNKGDSNHRALLNLLKRPLLWLRILVYLYVRTVARHKAKNLLESNDFVWERDDTSRNRGGLSASVL